MRSASRLTRSAALLVALVLSNAAGAQQGPPVTLYPPQQLPTQGFADTDPSALTAFRDVLDPYGSWIADPTYGIVWVPYPNAVGPNFVPYVTAGRWTYDDGWIWVSDYPWGWATFHYGRWVYSPTVGWAWVPGRQYAGAWVDWRVGGGYVGWGPQSPQWVWEPGGTAVEIAAQPNVPYYFCPQADVFAPNLVTHVVTGPAWVSRTVPYRQAAPPAYGAPPYRGPSPTTLGIPPNGIVRPSPYNEGHRRAVQYARPATAPRTYAQPPRVAAPPAQQGRPGLSAPQAPPPRTTPSAPAAHSGVSAPQAPAQRSTPAPVFHPATPSPVPRAVPAPPAPQSTPAARPPSTPAPPQTAPPARPAPAPR